MIPAISISGGQPVIYMPLLVVVAISAIKDIIEDYKRYRSDQEENNHSVNIINCDNNEKLDKWSSLRIGNIIKIY